MPHDLDLGSCHVAYRRASLIDLYLFTKFHSNRRNFLWADGVRMDGRTSRPALLGRLAGVDLIKVQKIKVPIKAQTSYLSIHFSFLSWSCSFGGLKFNLNWQSWTTFISLAQNNFIKNWLTTKYKLFVSVLFSGQASRPYNNTGAVHLLWMSCRVTSSDVKRPILPKISLAVL